MSENNENESKSTLLLPDYPDWVYWFDTNVRFSLRIAIKRFKRRLNLLESNDIFAIMLIICIFLMINLRLFF